MFAVWLLTGASASLVLFLVLNLRSQAEGGRGTPAPTHRAGVLTSAGMLLIAAVLLVAC